MIQKIKKLYRMIKKHFPSIKKGFKETLPLYKVAIQILFLQIAIALFQVVTPELYKKYSWVFQWVALIMAFYALVKLFIFTYYLYTEKWRDLDKLLQEYEGDISNFDFSFPNEFIKGVYHGEGIRGKNVDFIKRLDLGVRKLDPSQKRIALIHIKNYNSNTFNFFSGYNIFGILTVLATIATVLNFETLKSSLPFFVTLLVYGVTVGGYIYRINKKKLYICNVLEDVLSCSIKFE
jgi:hypothetical protein